jgi:hypothetical protein
LLADLEIEEVKALLKVSHTDKGKGKTKVKSQRLEGDALAVEILIEGGRGIKAAAQRFAAAVSNETPPEDDTPDTITVDGREVVPRLKVGSNQVTALIGTTLSETSWGGTVVADARDHITALKALSNDNADFTPFKPHDEHQIRWMLDRAVTTGITTGECLKLWNKFADNRARILQFADSLSDHPLLAIAGNGPLQELCAEYLDNYRDLISEVHNVAEALRKSGSIEPAKRLMGQMLALDVVFVRTPADFVAIAAPSHPFHIWKWLTLQQLFEDHRAELSEIGTDAIEPLVLDPPNSSPTIVLSAHVPGVPDNRTHAFVPVGSLGALPLFAEAGTRHAGKFRSRALGNIAQRFVRLLPHASFGLRVVFVDPPSISGVIEDLIDLANPFADESPIPLHATIAYTRDLQELTDEEDHELDALTREIRERGGSITVLPEQTALPRFVADVVPELRPHITVVFEPGEGQELRLGLTSPPTLSPLLMPRAYRYDPFDDRLDVIIAGESTPFAKYHDMFCEVVDIPTSDYVGRRSGTSRNQRQLEAIAAASTWLVVVDQAIEPTIRIGGATRLDWRQEAGRDLVTFTAHHESIEELVADALRIAGLRPTEETVKRTLNQISVLSGEALLFLAKPRPDSSLADKRVAKGLLGVVTAAQWYLDTYPDSLIISLDDPTSRTWVLGVNADDRQGDLLGLRLSSDGLTIDCIEVKTHADPEGAVRIRGTKIEGPASIQVDQTIRTLTAITSEYSKSALLSARRDILRDQLYRTVSSRPYSSEGRARYVRMLETLFSEGPTGIRGLIITAELTSSGERVWPSNPRFYTSPDDNNIGIVDIAETVASGASAPPSANQPEGQGKQPPTNDPPTSVKQSSGAKPTEHPRHAVGTAGPYSGPIDFFVGRMANEASVVWEPQRANMPLNNFGMLVTGDPGTGKTQFLRALISECVGRGLPACVFDFKNDYSDQEFAKSVGLTVFDIDRDGLPFNPLSLLPDKRGESQPIRQIHELTGILRRIFGLGDQQEAQLKKAMRRAYEDYGIAAEQRHKVASVGEVPSFSDVVTILEGDAKADKLLNRLSPLFDLELFPNDENAQMKFEQILDSAVVLDLHSLPDDRIKAALAEFIIVRLHGHVLKGDQPRELKRLLVFDEAWRVSDSERLQELGREGRAFGVGIAIGTQFPGDIPETLSGNLATQMLLMNSDIEHRKSVARTLTGSASSPEASRLIKQIAALKKHEGFFRNQHYTPYALVQTVPHYLRVPREPQL